MEDVRVSPLLEFIWEEMLQEQGGGFNENEEESADSQFLLPDNKEVDSNSLASISWAAKHSFTQSRLHLHSPVPPLEGRPLPY